MSQKASKIVKCYICDFECPSRGMAGHIRLKHKIVVKTVTDVVSVVSSQNDSSREYADLSHADSGLDVSSRTYAVSSQIDSSRGDKFDSSHPSELTKKAVTHEPENRIVKVAPRPIVTDIVFRETIGGLGFRMRTRYRRLIFISDQQAADYVNLTDHRRGKMKNYTYGNDPDVIIDGSEIFIYNG